MSLLFIDNKYFEERINEKDNQLFIASANFNELDLKWKKLSADIELLNVDSDAKLAEAKKKQKSIKEENAISL